MNRLYRNVKLAALTMALALGGVGFAATATLAAHAGALVHPITPSAGWSGQVCCGAGAPAWYQDAFGIIHLQGAVTQTIAGGSPLIATLPPAARPNREVFTIVHTFAGTFADLAIAPNGQIGYIPPRWPEVADPRFVSLEGITYQPANALPTTPIEINETNWTTNPTGLFGSTTPAWYKDPSGIVHLQGATRQWNAAFGGISVPGLIGALPAVAAPARTIFTIVHTYLGTHVTLEILPNGQLWVIGNLPQAKTDLSFLSLESVSFSPGALFNHINNVNSTNWTPAGGGPSEPGWVEDDAGIIHLQGAVNQTFLGGPNPSLVATLPAVIAPTRTIYTIVHTAGSFDDLAIAPNGQITIIAPRWPTALSRGNLSLEGVTYQP